MRGGAGPDHSRLGCRGYGSQGCIVHGRFDTFESGAVRRQDRDGTGTGAGDTTRVGWDRVYACVSVPRYTLRWTPFAPPRLFIERYQTPTTAVVVVVVENVFPVRLWRSSFVAVSLSAVLVSHSITVFRSALSPFPCSFFVFVCLWYFGAAWWASIWYLSVGCRWPHFMFRRSRTLDWLAFPLLSNFLVSTLYLSAPLLLYVPR